MPGVIIQQIRAIPIYSQKVIVFPHPYITDVLRYIWVAKIHPESCKALHIHSFSRCKRRSVDNLLNNKTIILLNFAVYIPQQLYLSFVIRHQLYLVASYRPLYHNISQNKPYRLIFTQKAFVVGSVLGGGGPRVFWMIEVSVLKMMCL